MTIGGIQKINCAYCGESVEVRISQDDIAICGKNVKCFKCGGVLWLDIEKREDDIEMGSNFPFVLLNKIKGDKQLLK